MLSRVIEKGIIFLLVFTPLAIGTTQPWSAAIMEIAAFIIFGAWVLKQASKEGIEQRAEGQGRSAEGIAHSVKGGGRCGRGGWILVFPVAMIVLTVLQIVPLPDWLLGLISPSACRIYKTFANDAAGSWRTISIYPDATIQELFKLLSYTSVFFVVINHYRTKAQVNSLVRIIIYMGCFLAVFAVLQKMTWNGRLFWFYPLREGLTSNMGYIWGPYINHNHFAGYMEMAIPLAIGFLLYKRSRMGSLSHIPLRTKIARLLDSSDIVAMALLSLAVVTMSAALFLSLSRGGMIGFTASMFFLIGIMRTSRTLKKKAGLFALLGLAVFFVVVLASWDRIEDRFEEIGKEQKIMRPEVWADTVNMVKDFPILGTGLGTFGGIYPHYQTGNSRFVFEHAENDYIEILTDTGIIGFIIIIGMASLFFYSVIKAWRFRHNTFVKCIAVGGISSCVAIAVHSFTDFNMRIPANALLLTVIAGITYAAVYNVSESREHGA